MSAINKMRLFQLGQTVEIIATGNRAVLMTYQLDLNGCETWHVVWWGDNVRHSQWLFPQEIKNIEGVQVVRLD